MERHNTHILSCSSSLENNNSYIFDKNGNILLDSVSSVSYINYKRRNKITTSELFKGIQNFDNNSIKEEENVLNKNKDNNITFSKNQINSKYNNKYQKISKIESFMYTPSGKENKDENNNNINKTNLKENKENNDNKIKNNEIIKKSNFNSIEHKYDDKYLREIKLELIFLKSIKQLKNNTIGNRNKKISTKENKKDKNGTYELKAKFSERMKFSSKTNSFLSPIKDKLKEKDNYFNYNDFIINPPINNFCYITKFSPLIIKYKINNLNVINKLCFFTKENIKYDQDKNSKIKESIILDESDNKDLYEKIIKNKYKISDITDKKSILNKTNENEYNKDYFNIPNDLKDNNNINNDIKKNYQEQNNINNENINNNLYDINNKEEEQFFNSKINHVKKENYAERNYLIKNKFNDISNNLLLNQKTNKLNEKNNFHKHLNAYSSKKQKIPDGAFYTPNKIMNNTIDNKIRTFYKINQINSPFLLMHKNIQNNIQKNKLFSNESTISKINSRKNIKYEKQNRNKSLVNVINHNHNNIDLSNQEKNHFYQQLIINEGKKYDRHFGKEENCPICVALQVKNKLLEEKKILPILKPNHLNKCDHPILTHSPNKNTENNKRRIMSCKTNIIRKLNIRRNESAKQIMNKNRNLLENEKNDFLVNKNTKNIFPCLNEYFNANN